MADGHYAYYVRCEDSSPSKNKMLVSAKIEFTITTTPEGGEPSDPDAPVVTLIRPENNNKTNESIIKFQYNVTDKSSILFCELIIDNVTKQPDSTVTRNITQNFTQGMAYGNHTWNVNCTDTRGNRNSSVVWNVSSNATADFDDPDVNLMSPPNNTIRNWWLTGFSYNTTDATSPTIAYCDLHMNGLLDSGGSVNWDIRDSQVEQDVEETIDIPLFEGNYTWNVSCVDGSYSANEGYSETWKIRINVTPGEEAFVTSCAGWCAKTDPTLYDGGVCRQTSALCKPVNNEVYEQGGDAICLEYESQTGDHCCCRLK